MYKNHRNIILIIFIGVFALGYLYEVNYKLIATEVITIISIILAVYMASFSQLVSSEITRELKQTPDKEIPEKSQLGVITEYFKTSFLFGLLSIVASCLYLLEIFPLKFVDEAVTSAFALSLLSVNFVFIWLLFEFMVNRQLRE